MIGIYYWKNKLNNKYYIGQSVDINRRIIAHRSLAKNGKEDKLLYLSMRQHGIENFEWGVLEECSIDKLDEREKYWIEYYNSYINGYNANRGGQDGSPSIGEENGRTNLTNSDVLRIRERVYIEKEDMWEVYKDYDLLIGKDRFWSLVHGDSWKNVDTSMIYSLKEKGYKNFDGSKNPHAKLLEEDVRKIRYLIEVEKVSRKDLYENYKDRISYSTFGKIIRYETWKNVKY